MGGLVGARALPKSRATSRYAHPPPSFQLSNPLPNSPGTPTHLGHPHGQLSLSTLVHQSPQVQKQPPTSKTSKREASSKVSDRCKSLACIHLSSVILLCTNSAPVLRSTSPSFASFMLEKNSCSQIIHHFVLLQLLSQHPPSHSALLAKCGNMFSFATELQSQRGQSIKHKNHNFHCSFLRQFSNEHISIWKM